LEVSLSSAALFSLRPSFLLPVPMLRYWHFFPNMILYGLIRCEMETLRTRRSSAITAEARRQGPNPLSPPSTISGFGSKRMGPFRTKGSSPTTQPST
jgi:hypothetical protein